MKTKERKILIGGLILLILVLPFLFSKRKKEIQIIVPLEQNYTEEKIEPVVEINNQKNDGPKKIQNENNIKVTLSVLDKKYETEIKKGVSVFDAMKMIEEKSIASNPFSFKYKEILGLGSFVTEINGTKGSPGKYWIYYVNNEKATVGVSGYILKDGDIIKWNQEGL